MSRQQMIKSLEDFVQIRQGCNCSYFEQIRLYIIKEKYLYLNLNYLVMQGSIFTGSFWLPARDEQTVEAALREVSAGTVDRLPTGQIQEVKPLLNQTPPTYFKLNEVTGVFQEIVNTYGVPRYQEINPGLFTIVTFPFLFGVMFADIGHGFLLLLTGLYVTFAKTSLEKSDSMFKMMIPGRYLILLMGFFAFYNGLIYNDYLSIPLNLFGSCYNLDHIKHEWVREKDCVYPFGLDPVWLASKSALLFINSYKMKLAVIIGVVHMVFGILMKGVNTIYFRNKIDFWCEFVPQLLFMLAAFGWMDFLIVSKWFYKYEPGTDPSIIDSMINQILSPFKTPEKPIFVGKADSQLFWAQLLTAIALLCVPWMLIPKPFILTRKSQHGGQPYTKVVANENQPLLNHQHPRSESELEIDPGQFEQALQKAASRLTPQNSEHAEEHDTGDIVVHQIIETIEFVLGGISNTASYLRLWALSLAHGQLAEVFFDMCLAGKLSSGGVLGGAMGAYFYIVFAMLTFGVLMVMDVMECFLHALRLHWVEFQNKFYKADGYLFVGYSYHKLLNENCKAKDE